MANACQTQWIQLLSKTLIWSKKCGHIQYSGTLGESDGENDCNVVLLVTVKMIAVLLRLSSWWLNGCSHIMCKWCWHTMQTMVLMTTITFSLLQLLVSHWCFCFQSHKKTLKMLTYHTVSSNCQTCKWNKTLLLL